MSDGLHKTEDRADLEYRFRAFAAFLMKARETQCDRDGCLICALVNEPVDTLGLVSPTGHEPREDLEKATEILAERMAEIATAEGAADCPRGAFIVDLLTQVEGGGNAS